MEAVVAKNRLGAVRFDDETGLLLEAELPYQLTIEELHAVFVENAPFSDEREFLFSMFTNYLRQVREIVPDKRVWVDGSFVSMREDRAPSDVDVALLVNGPTPKQRRELLTQGLLTMSEVAFTMGQKQMPKIGKLSPYGGLVDAYVVDAGSPAEVAHWQMLWSTPKGPDGSLEFERSKGFVEVITNDNPQAATVC